ncbi:MAG TPA: right-handed parallel beta-helix repeat-containing protein [Flavobacteriales bacterium]|nr:right-handed parallel beta-helix repeat-containing protein [Flavobacteriales bacterium]HQW86370.1 right-handed parallel beta-helix repeat-containing protein [Flavobacteriales bacterium]
MIHRPTLFLACAALLGTSARAQLQRIVVQGTGAPQVFTSIYDAVAGAQPNDKLYFSGGTFLADSGLTLTIPLHFIGAGIHPDSTSVTTPTILTTNGNADFTFTTGASGSSFTGIRFNPGGEIYYGIDGTDDDPVDMLFERCTFKFVRLGWVEPSTSSSTFNECIFYDGIYASGGAATIDRSVVQGGPLNIFRPSGLIMSNSVILGQRLQNSQNAIVQNCVFTYAGAPLWQVSGVQITNCIINGAGMFSNSGGNTETNTIYSQTPAMTFVSETDGAYQFTDDLHLLPGSPGIGAGNDGTDIGLYGTSSPYKPGNVPYNPHFRNATIAPATNPDGTLPVNIRVAAQPN